MCTVIAWSGKMPRGMLTQLLSHAESRGRDSTGIAYHETDGIITHRQCIPASRFIQEHQDLIGRARKSTSGIAHARRASPGNPINNDNAHPFAYFQYVFAHNGRIDNADALRDAHIAELKAQSTLTEKETRQLRYFEACTTDSMIIGPYIHKRDFTDLVGDMGLVWLSGHKVYCMHTCKELSCATLTWTTPDENGQVTIAASTPAIITDSAKDCPDLSFTSQFYIVEEHRIYNLTPAVLLDEGPVPVNPENKHDTFSSSVIDSLPLEDNNNIEPDEKE